MRRVHRPSLTLLDTAVEGEWQTLEKLLPVPEPKAPLKASAPPHTAAAESDLSERSPRQSNNLEAQASSSQAAAKVQQP